MTIQLQKIEAGYYEATIEGIQVTCFKDGGFWNIELQGKTWGDSVTEWTKADCIAWAQDYFAEFQRIDNMD